MPTEPREEHILVCLSSAPSNPKIVRTGAGLARAFHGTFTALFVKTPSYDTLSPENKQRLQENTRLAERLGATVEISYGEDVPYQIAEFARLSGVTKIVLGRSTVQRRHPWSKPTLAEKLTELAPTMDIHIIPDAIMQAAPLPEQRKPPFQPLDLAKTAGVLCLTTAVAWLFHRLGFAPANLMALYVLAVLSNAVMVSGWVCNLLASAAGVLLFTFLFAEPRFTFVAYEQGYPVTMVAMFCTSFAVSSFAGKLKNHAKASARQGLMTRTLLETNQRLQQARTEQEVLIAAGEQVHKLFRRDVAVFDEHLQPLLEPNPLFAEAAERQAAAWVLAHNKRAGAGTDIFPRAKAAYLAIRMNEKVYGVLGIAMAFDGLDAAEQSILLSILGECALAMDSKRNAWEREQAALLAQSEQLRANLLRSISHDLRTPLTSISGNASNLRSQGRSMDQASREQIYTDIYDDAMWLISLVENLLAVTRIEEGRMQLRLSMELMDEILQEAMAHISRNGTRYHICVHEAQELVLVQCDSRLLVQVLVNLIDNAIKYTPPGSQIDIRYRQLGDRVQVQVADNGPGIPDEKKETVFDMFATCNEKIADSRRSLGLGLYLCKAIIAAHGGELTLQDNDPTGCIFTFYLKSGEVTLDE